MNFNDKFKNYYFSEILNKINYFPIELRREISPIVYLKRGFNTEEINSKNIKFFTDTNQNFKYLKYLDHLESFSQEEIDLVLKVSEKFVENNLPIPKNNIIASLKTLRTIKKFLPINSTILDFGSGSGIDAIVLALSGYKVISFDITTSLFIYQNHIYKIFFQEGYKYCEQNIDLNLDKKIFHVPFTVWFERNFSLEKLDGINANYVLNEISPINYLYLHKLINNNFKLNRKKLYIFSAGPGATNSSNFFYLKNFGFKIINRTLNSELPNYVYEKFSSKYLRNEKFANFKKKASIIYNLLHIFFKKKGNLNEFNKQQFLNIIKTKYPSFFELNADEKFVTNLDTTKYAMEDIKIFLNEKY